MTKNKNNLLPFFCAVGFISLMWFFISGVPADKPNLNVTNQLNMIPTVNFIKSITST